MTKGSPAPVDAWLPVKPLVFQVLLALSDGERHGCALCWRTG
jgi:hypothetical protein